MDNASVKPWFIKDTAFTSRVSEEDMAVFMKVCPDKRYKKGDFIFHAGDDATDLHVLAQGQVKLVTPTASGSERILAILGPNDFFGEAFLAEDETYRVDAIALTDAMTCPVSRNQFKHMALSAPGFVLTFAEIMAGHLFACRDQLSSSYAPVKARVIKTLLEQAKRFGRDEGTGWVKLSTELKHEELASMITATRVSVSMAMAELRGEGLLEGTRGEYRLHVGAMHDQLELS
ncbi:MAG: Crp/Fnr family transcriptional regulator [Trueperaceae bacterium]|nr:Crp/Fnr family transcriptional regulator [Trueperaceae bacterium]